MKRKHLILLALVAIVLGAIYLLRQETAEENSPADTLLLPEEFFRNCAIAIAASLLLLCLVLALTGRKQKK